MKKTIIGILLCIVATVIAIKSFHALDFAAQLLIKKSVPPKTIVPHKKEKTEPQENNWIIDNSALYNVYTNTDERFVSYNILSDAFDYARIKDRSFIYSRETNALIWTNIEQLKEKHVIEDIPLILQKPELPRGCEVTSLAMMLNYAGINVTKMELAENIKKDETPLQYKNGKKYYGHPNTGFVGDMYNIKKDGFGVYHKPISELANLYLPDKIIDLTGVNFSELQYFLNQSIPVWVIINSSYTKLPDNNFETWITPVGEIKITYSEHSVVITGYDSEYIYFNDPLVNSPNKKAPRNNFIEAWIQMGRQAITYIK